jgi:hypothetical protein
VIDSHKFIPHLLRHTNIVVKFNKIFHKLVIVFTAFKDVVLYLSRLLNFCRITSLLPRFIWLIKKSWVPWFSFAHVGNIVHLKHLYLFDLNLSLVLALSIGPPLAEPLILEDEYFVPMFADNTILIQLAYKFPLFTQQVPPKYLLIKGQVISLEISFELF